MLILNAKRKTIGHRGGARMEGWFGKPRSDGKLLLLAASWLLLAILQDLAILL